MLSSLDTTINIPRKSQYINYNCQSSLTRNGLVQKIFFNVVSGTEKVPVSYLFFILRG